MDPGASSWWPFYAPDEPSPRAARVAEALAATLAAIVPAPFHVRAERGWVWLSDGPAGGSGVGIGETLDQVLEPEDGETEPEDWPFVDRVRSAAWYVLSSVQDGIAETTTEPWPRLPQGGMANPGTRVDDGSLHWWYGPHDDAPTDAVLLLPPIDLRPFLEPEGPAGGAAA